MRLTVRARRVGLLAVLIVVGGSRTDAAQTDTQPTGTSPAEILVITEDTQLDPQRTYGRIEIRASNITIDGRGAWLIGKSDGEPRDFQDAAILAENVSDVTLKNVRAKGWETGIVVRNGHNWTIEGCDFSDNFHDPQFGWGENGRRGGMVLERVSESVVRNNRANRVWDACVLVDCHKNRLEGNDFSHTSNTCLKLWTATGNHVADNILSYGIRKDPGEVHARDSTSVLIESGSDNNHFLRNDCTHGGDGIFIRVLNGWVSSGNVFEENDCSYANNNCVEAWAPRNIYIRNKANYGSYGFWLGASDQTVLEGNEACWNGLPDGNHNSPHLPDQGHAGIVFMFGPSSHTRVIGNICVGNNGAGIAAIGDLESQGEKWRAFHWIIQQNRLEKNRWGIFLQCAEWIDMAANQFVDNTAGDVHEAGHVTRLTQRTSELEIKRAPQVRLSGPATARVGQPISWDASASRDPQGQALHFEWDFGDGSHGDQARVEHIYRAPGFYRLGLTVHNGLLSDLSWRDMYVTEEVTELGSEGSPEGWSCLDPSSQCRFQADHEQFLCGQQSLLAHVDPYGGGRVTLGYRLPATVGLPGPAAQLVFWLTTRNENTPAWQDLNPLVTLVDEQGNQLELTPARDLLSTPPYNEARDGWTYFVVPLCGSQLWQRSGPDLDSVRELRFGFDSWGAPPLQIRLDGIAILPDERKSENGGRNLP